MQVNADFVKHFSAQDVEVFFRDYFKDEETPVDLKFTGPGLYATKTTTILAVPCNRQTRTDFWQPNPKDKKFLFYVYCCPIHATVFGMTTRPPLRYDDRYTTIYQGSNVALLKWLAIVGKVTGHNPEIVTVDPTTARFRLTLTPEQKRDLEPQWQQWKDVINIVPS